jgi:hypothetical protein
LSGATQLSHGPALPNTRRTDLQMNYVSAMRPRLLSRTSGPHTPVIERRSGLPFPSPSCVRAVRRRAVGRGHHRTLVCSVSPDEEQLAAEKGPNNKPVEFVDFPPAPSEEQCGAGLPPAPKVVVKGADGSPPGAGPPVNVQFSVHYSAFNWQILCLAGNTAPLGWAFNNVSRHPAKWENNIWLVKVGTTNS